MKNLYKKFLILSNNEVKEIFHHNAYDESKKEAKIHVKYAKENYDESCSIYKLVKIK